MVARVRQRHIRTARPLVAVVAVVARVIQRHVGTVRPLVAVIAVVVVVPRTARTLRALFVVDAVVAIVKQRHKTVRPVFCDGYSGCERHTEFKNTDRRKGNCSSCDSHIEIYTYRVTRKIINGIYFTLG